MSRAETLIKLEEILAKPGGKQAIRFAISSLGGAIPVIGSSISAAVSIWAEKGQNQSTTQILEWAKLADAELSRLSDAVSNLLAVPSRSSMAILLGELFGDDLANRLLLAGGQIAVVLNPATVSELEPYVSRGWLSLRPTGAACSMGANNRVGNHLEELKRPYGIGSGFVMVVAKIEPAE